VIRKESSEGIGYSVIERHRIRHVFAAAAPRDGNTLAEQAHDALQTIERVMAEEGTHRAIVRQDVFVSQPGDFPEAQRIIHDFYGSDLPATSYIAQPPCNGKLIAIEAMGLGRGCGLEHIVRVSEQVVVTCYNDITCVHCAHVRPSSESGSVYDRSRAAFEQLARAVNSQGLAFDRVIRTWLYLGDIVGPEGETQRYMELNRARTDCFRGIEFGKGMTLPGRDRPIYPASTGIGTDGRDIVMSCIALSTPREDVRVVALENPQQVSAFDYGSRYGEKSPKFARAMAVTQGPCAIIYVSGTASITDSETRHVGDVEGQTWLTLDNIAALISEQNLGAHGLPGMGATLDDMALVRVYVKRAGDYAKVKAVCDVRLGELPSIYAVGDVCRHELLVEIEGIAFSTSCLRGQQSRIRNLECQLDESEHCGCPPNEIR
jgi:enamine deaminase RidA (YjgF/YER057c/UK114 family)